MPHNAHWRWIAARHIDMAPSCTALWPWWYHYWSPSVVNVSSGFDLWDSFVIRVLPLPLLFQAQLSFWNIFVLFLLCWDELGCELSLSTKGHLSIPHKFLHQDDSCCRVLKLVFFWFEISHWLASNWVMMSKRAHPLPCVTLFQIWWQLVLIWPQIGQSCVWSHF